MRYGPHLDGREDRLSEESLAEEVRERADGLVVAHVLIHRQRHAGLPRAIDEPPRGGEVERERLLGEDATDLPPAREGRLEDLGLGVRRDGNVEHGDFGVIDHLAPAPPRPGNAVAPGHRERLRGVPAPAMATGRYPASRYAGS